MKSIRKSPATLDVLAVMCGAADPIWGLQIVRHTSRATGTIYPILARLEDAGWIESEWENVHDHGGPKRRYYRLTVDGDVAARQLIENTSAAMSSAVIRIRPAFGSVLSA